MSATLYEMKTEALIVGGGPAGATAARFLAEGGVETILVERDFSYVKPCAGGIREPALEEFGLPCDISRKIIGKLLLVSPGNRKAEIELKDNNLAIIHRGSFDAALRRLASEKGAITLEAQFLGFEEGSGERIALVKKREDGALVKIRSTFILAADGIRGSVAKSLGLSRRPRFYTISAFIPSFDGDACEFWLSSGQGSSFSWMFPAIRGVSIGTSAQDPHILNTMLDAFTVRRYDRSLKALQAEENIAPPRIFPIPHWDESNLRDGNIFFLGDAAGLVEPITGEGIYYAMKSGKYAAHAIIRKAPEQYEQLLHKGIYRQFATMRDTSAGVFKSDRSIEEWFPKIKRRLQGRTVSGATGNASRRNAQRRARPPILGEDLSKEPVDTAKRAPVPPQDAASRQVLGILVISRRAIENPGMFLQYIANRQRSAGHSISAKSVARFATMKDIDDKALIDTAVRKEFPDLDDANQATTVYAFTTADGNEGKYCLVFNHP